MVEVFDAEVFFEVFRETIELAVVVSVLLAFVKQGVGAAAESSEEARQVIRRLRTQIWLGTILGVIICIALGAIFIGLYYRMDDPNREDSAWSNTEDMWEGVFCIVSTFMISIVGLTMLRINKMQEKWRLKLAKSILSKPDKKQKFSLGFYSKKYAMFILPLVTCLKEGLEAVVSVGGINMGKENPSAFPLAVIAALVAGSAVGVVIYYSGANTSIQVFLVCSTSFLYLIAAGLFSKGVWSFESYYYSKKYNLGPLFIYGTLPSTYASSHYVWHLDCCYPESSGGWGIFNSLFGWQNHATVGSVVSYNVYWIVMITAIMLLLHQEQYGHLPLAKNLRLEHFSPFYYLKKHKKHVLTPEEEEEVYERFKRVAFFKRWKRKEDLEKIAALPEERTHVGDTSQAEESKEVEYAEKVNENTEVEEVKNSASASELPKAEDKDSNAAKSN